MPTTSSSRGHHPLLLQKAATRLGLLLLAQSDDALFNLRAMQVDVHEGGASSDPDLVHLDAEITTTSKKSTASVLEIAGTKREGAAPSKGEGKGTDDDDESDDAEYNLAFISSFVLL